jgi:hypothetical protein
MSAATIPGSDRVVAEVADHRTRHLKTDYRVSMSENWERAIASAKGRYLTILGDDTGCSPPPAPTWRSFSSDIRRSS